MFWLLGQSGVPARWPTSARSLGLWAGRGLLVSWRDGAVRRGGGMLWRVRVSRARSPRCTGVGVDNQFPGAGFSIHRTWSVPPNRPGPTTVLTTHPSRQPSTDVAVTVSVKHPRILHRSTFPVEDSGVLLIPCQQSTGRNPAPIRTGCETSLRVSESPDRITHQPPESFYTPGADRNLPIPRRYLQEACQTSPEYPLPRHTTLNRRIR